MKCTLRQLGYFVAASDHGSISAASKALNVSQPSVSVTISQIEKSYGVELFTRKNSVGINLTTAGQIVLREARMLLAHANDFDALATDVAQEVSGEIRIASFVNIAPIYMASIIRSFQKSHPDVLVKTFIGNQKEILEGIRSGHFEVAVSFDLGLSNEFRIDVGRSLPPSSSSMQITSWPIARQRPLVISSRNPLSTSTYPIAEITSSHCSSVAA